MDTIYEILIGVGCLLIGFILAVFLVAALTRKFRPYAGEVHVVRDNYDGEAYMFLVIEKGKDIYIQNGEMITLKVVEDIPERGKDR